MWLGCAGAFEADFQKALRSLFDILRAHGVTVRRAGEGAVHGRRRQADRQRVPVPGARAAQNIEDFQRGRRDGRSSRRARTACKTIGGDYQAFGFDVEVVHSAVFVAELTHGDARRPARDRDYHDPCYLGRYAGRVEEPRELLARFGAEVTRAGADGHNPFCCGAGGGLLFEEHEEGKRISQERFEQLQATGRARRW